MSKLKYPKRLIEVDLPIKRISAHAKRDQNIRKGHLHSMHLWWATRPLASCRAVIMATLLPDPADELCPDSFRKKARESMQEWADKHLKLLSAESYPHFITYQKDHNKLKDKKELQNALLNFIADFASWEAGVNPTYLSTARELVAVAHHDGSPLVLDPFAGAGSIPFEALRIGASSFATDLNPVAVLLNKVSQEYLPRYGSRLTNEVEKWGKWILEEARKKLQPFYPADEKGNIPLAYIWARTVKCEGPRCGAEVPLLGMLWLSHKTKKRVALRYHGDKKTKQVHVDIFKPKSANELQPPLTQRFSVTCPVCQFTTPYKKVRAQISNRNGGTHDSRLIAIIMLSPDGERTYRMPDTSDIEAIIAAKHELEHIQASEANGLSVVPNEPLPPDGTLGYRINKYGMQSWSDVYLSRQLLALTTFCELVRNVHDHVRKETGDCGFADAVGTCLGLVTSNLSRYLSSVSVWSFDHFGSAFMQGSGLAMRPDFAEANPLMPRLVGGFENVLQRIVSVLEHECYINQVGVVQQGSATRIPLPDNSVSYLVTDPPYYDAIPYAALSDFCYVWLKRTTGLWHTDLFGSELTPKAEECILDPGPPANGGPKKDKDYFETTMQAALKDARRTLRPDGVGVVIFAHKGTAGWEAMLSALVNGGWTVTASWPINTEWEGRMRARNSAALGSSVHLVCRPRITTKIGDWRGVLPELPKRIHEWMPRLAEEGVVGADAIFACLGPALEVFSRYSKVEKASGEEVTLREYLEHVWAAVEKEALNMIFEGADAAGFEEDSRLTAMWLWTLSTGANGNGEKKSTDEQTTKSVGYTLEFDAARKIAQGLGAHLENLGRMVEIKGDKARLLSVAERTKYLFGKDESQAPVGKRKKKDSQMQLDFMAEVQKAEREEGGWGEKNAPRAGDTVLDQLHQAMILFAAGRGEAMKRFLVEEGIGRDGRFWRLAQAFSALYPSGTDEKRWVDGVLARKKSLGF